MLAATGLLQNCDRTLQQQLSFAAATLRPINHRQIVKGEADVGMSGGQQGLTHGQRSLRQ